MERIKQLPLPDGFSLEKITEKDKGWIQVVQEECKSAGDMYEQIVNPGEKLEQWVQLFNTLRSFAVKEFGGEPTFFDKESESKKGKKEPTGNQDMKEKIKNLLETNHQVILTGAPGTGKTYVAKEIAKDMVDGDEARLKFVQFHPGYDYSDFVIGLKPELKNEQVSFYWKDGIFKQFCDNARGDADKKFVMIIDEINRADLSRVFGELFFCLEETYRGEKIILPSSGEFTIPKNVYIIGTMNDIDRSVESMDFALRRRFAWYEVKAEDTGECIIDSAEIGSGEKKAALGKMEAVNKKLGDLNFGEEYSLGGAYFKKTEKYAGEQDKWKKLWDNHIEVILKEYLRGRRSRDADLGALKEAYDGAGRQSKSEPESSSAESPAEQSNS